MNEIIERTPEVLTPLETLASSSLIVKAEAKLTINDFGEDFKTKADFALSSLANKLETDEDFEKAEKDIKASKEFENKLAKELDALVSSNKELADVKQTIEKYISTFAAARLDLNKSVTKRDLEKKKSITDAGVKKVADAIAISPVKKYFQPRNQTIIDAIKRKSSYSVMEKCVAELVDAEVKRLANLETVFLTNATAIDKAKLEYPTLFPDREALSVKGIEIVALTIESRITAHKLAEKERLECEAKKAVEEKRLKVIDDAKTATTPAQPSMHTPDHKPLPQENKPIETGWTPPAPPIDGPDPFTTPTANEPKIGLREYSVTIKTTLEENALVYLLSRISGINGVKIA